MMYEIYNMMYYGILHFSFFIEFCEAKFLWASRFASLASGYPLHHPHGYFIAVAGGSASIPLAVAAFRRK